ncbi:hypothetical protein HY008_01610, partial [Candidatus Woesebacteria bacterium]|nr:hypothetical protein [Candidatus Woesebacteria bacterium]
MRAKLLYFVISLFFAFGPLVKVIYSQEFVISDNGSDSESNITVNQLNSSTVTQVNNSDIENNIIINANTGNNEASENNSADTSIQTGEISVKVSVENMANATLVQDPPCCDPAPRIEISSNGSESQNSISVNQLNSSSINQTNIADPVVNNIVVSANTGGNVANENNGNVTIKTGDIFLDFLIQNKPINFGGIFNFEVKAEEEKKEGEEKEERKQEEKEKEEAR